MPDPNPETPQRDTVEPGGPQSGADATPEGGAQGTPARGGAEGTPPGGAAVQPETPTPEVPQEEPGPSPEQPPEPLGPPVPEVPPDPGEPTPVPPPDPTPDEIPVPQSPTIEPPPPEVPPGTIPTGTAAPAQPAAEAAAPAHARSGRREAPATAGGPRLKVTQTGSPIGRQGYQRATLIGLGLNKMHRTRVVPDTPSMRGRIETVKHLVKVEPAE